MLNSSALFKKINNPSPGKEIAKEQKAEEEKGPFEERKSKFKDSSLAYDILKFKGHPVYESVKGLIKAKKEGIFNKITEEQYNQIGRNDGCDGALIAAVYDMRLEEIARENNKSL